MKLCIKQYVILTLRQYSLLFKCNDCVVILSRNSEQSDIKDDKNSFFIHQIALSHFSLMAPKIGYLAVSITCKTLHLLISVLLWKHDWSSS